MKKKEEKCKEITNNTVHLCMSCKKHYPECEAKEIIFGDGFGKDNICCCNKYDPLWIRVV